MKHFANQCLDFARLLLERQLPFIQTDGSITPAEGEGTSPAESAHAIAAIGEFYRATHELNLQNIDLSGTCAHCLTHQMAHESSLRATTYAGLGLLAFGTAKERNPVWQQLDESTRSQWTQQMLQHTHANGLDKAFAIAQSIVRYTFGLAKRDETTHLLQSLANDIQHQDGYFADVGTAHAHGSSSESHNAVFDNAGITAFVLVRHVLGFYTRFGIVSQTLPTLRAVFEKYIKLLPDLIRNDGLGWCYGDRIGLYGQLDTLSFILQFLSDGWIVSDKISTYCDCMRRLFQYFSLTYMDLENSCLVVNDAERASASGQTTRLMHFDVIRHLCQWAQLASNLPYALSAMHHTATTKARFLSMEKTYTKEQGLFVYQDASSGLLVQLPLMHSREMGTSDTLAFPHCPGIFDWPVQAYLPILQPELTIEGNAFIPSFYGKNCSTGIDIKKAFFFSYQQPELIATDESIVPGIGSCSVTWKFHGTTLNGIFEYTFKRPVIIDRFRYAIALALPHSCYHAPNTLTFGENNLQASILKNDFGSSWNEVQDVHEDPAYKTYYGKIYYLQILERKIPLHVQAGKPYALHIELKPDIKLCGANVQ